MEGRIFRLSQLSEATSLQTRYNSMLSGNASYNPSSFDSIATVTVGSGGSSSVEFTSIPSTYTHLQVRISAQTDRATYGLDDIKCILNSDTGANYAWHTLRGNGSTAFAGAGSSSSTPQFDSFAGTTTSNIFAAGVIDILDYKNTNKYKTLRGLGGGDHNGTIAGYGGEVGLFSNLWQNTNAITGIKFTPIFGTNFTQYTKFALYGIKGA